MGNFYCDGAPHCCKPRKGGDTMVGKAAPQRIVRRWGVSKRREPFVYCYAECAVTDSYSGGWDLRNEERHGAPKNSPQRIVRRWGVQREGILCLLLRRMYGHRFTQPGLGLAEGERHGSGKEFTPADCAPLGCPKGGEPFVYCYAGCAAIDSRKWAGPAEHSTD